MGGPAQLTLPERGDTGICTSLTAQRTREGNPSSCPSAPPPVSLLPDHPLFAHFGFPGSCPNFKCGSGLGLGPGPFPSRWTFSSQAFSSYPRHSILTPQYLFLGKSETRLDSPAACLWPSLECPRALDTSKFKRDSGFPSSLTLPHQSLPTSFPLQRMASPVAHSDSGPEHRLLLHAPNITPMGSPMVPAPRCVSEPTSLCLHTRLFLFPLLLLPFHSPCLDKVVFSKPVSDLLTRLLEVHQ